MTYMTYVPTRLEGLSRLNAFLPKAGRDYARLRNSDFGPGQHDHVSCLSPYLRHRLVAEREVVAAVLQNHSPAESEKFVQEVFWRTYFKGWLEHNPHIWTRYKTELQTAVNALDTGGYLRKKYDQALAGETNIACFDHWVSELKETGYLHNHARMWFASIWIFTLKLPWQLGADFFLRHLLDGDPASNTLSWRWVGGLHTKGKTYLARPDNIERFTNGRFNPVGQLASFADPLIEMDEHVPNPILPQTHTVPNVPFLLLVHEEDCLPETLLREDQTPAHILGVTATASLSPLTVDGKVRAFAKGAVMNGLGRMGAERAVIEDNWAEPLIRTCEAAAIKNIVTAYMPIGPSAEALARASPALNAAGISVSQILRPWDIETWPYANRGFFKVKKKMGRILSGLNQNETQGQLL